MPARWARPGESNHNAKLTETQVLAARRLTRMRQAIPTIRQLAKQFGVAPRVLEMVIKGDTWRHLPNVTTEQMHKELSREFFVDFSTLR